MSAPLDLQPLLDALSNTPMTITETELQKREKQAAIDASSALAWMGRQVSYNPDAKQAVYAYPENVRKDAELMAYNIYEPTAGRVKPENFGRAETFLKLHEPTARGHPSGGQLADAMRLGATKLQAAIAMRQQWQDQQKVPTPPQPPPKPSPQPKPPADQGDTPADQGDTPTPTPSPANWTSGHMIGAAIAVLALLGLAGWAVMMGGGRSRRKALPTR